MTRYVPQLRIHVTYTLAHPYLVGQNLTPLSIVAPSKYRGWLRSILAHIARNTMLMPIPIVKEGGSQNFVYRYLVSSSSPIAHKLLARLNVIGYFFGTPVIGYSQISSILGEEAAHYANFLKSGISVVNVSVDRTKIQCHQLSQGVRDDLSATSVTNPHNMIICQVPRTITVTFQTIPHPYDVVAAPEEAWNGALSGKAFIEGLKHLIELLQKSIMQIEAWRLSPFPGRSKNLVTNIKIEYEEQVSTVPAPQDIDTINRKVADIARRLALALQKAPVKRR